MLPGSHAAASDLVEASLLLAPERRMTHLTRALLRFQRGDREGALADADVIAGESAEAAESLRSYAAVVFRGFDGWPGQETFAPDPELTGVPLELAHNVEEIRHAAGVYATRIGRARAAIRALVADGAPGVVAARHRRTCCRRRGRPAARHDRMRARGPGPGRRRRRRRRRRSGADAAPETIEIDEELATDGAGVPELLAVAHADWAALSWLCWAVGLDRVELPDAATARGELAAAMKMIVRRTWRIKDRLASGSLIARSQGVPGFAWQGIDIDELPRHLAEMAAAEYIAARSMFIWLASADALSPFQDDIRDV